MDNYFAENLRFLRYRKGSSVQEVSRAARVSEQAVRFWEEGKRIPGAKNLKKLADYFGVSSEALLTDMMKVETEVTRKPSEPPRDQVVKELQEIKTLLAELVNITKQR